MANLLLEREQLTKENDSQSQESLGSFCSFQKRRLPRFTISTEMACLSILGEISTSAPVAVESKETDE